MNYRLGAFVLPVELDPLQRHSRRRGADALHRAAELDVCPFPKLPCPLAKVVPSSLKTGKIQLILWNKQPTYADFLKVANQLQEEICMISNSDIWVRKCDQELINLLKQHPNIGFSLTRSDRDASTNIISSPNGNWKPGEVGGFDSFIFKSPINIDYNLINHIQNRPGSEHVFKTELEHKGIRFYNLCYDICIVHEHLSNVRTYTKKDDLLWEIDLSDNSIYKYTKTLTPTPPQKKLPIMRNYFKKYYQKKKYSTISQMFSR